MIMDKDAAAEEDNRIIDESGQFEHKTEFRALDHGLGWQLRDWAAETGASYFSAEFFEQMMQEKPEYGSFFSPEASREGRERGFE